MPRVPDAPSGFLSLSNEFLGCAILGPAGVVESSGDDALWRERGQSLLDAADRAAGSRATHVHVATEEGEAFAVRCGEFAMVAVTSRFTLASLVLADMRATLRRAAARAETRKAA